jgi:branched-chain amino acid transport system permease protein
MEIFFQALINGIFIGGVYAAYSAGFSLIFGVMEVINLAHGDFLMIGAFTAYWLYNLGHIDPYITIPFAGILLFFIGYFIQKFSINRVIDKPPVMSYILTFGIHLVITNLAIKLWTHDFRSVTTSYSGMNFEIWGITVPVSRFITFLLSFVIIGFLFYLLEKTNLGRAIRAVSQNKKVAELLGVDIKKIYALTFGIGAAITGIAGASISPFVILYPEMGLNYTIVAFCVVVLGGMGYIPGALIGGFILGIIQALTVTYLNAGISVAITFILLYIMLILKPAGITGKGNTV